MKIIVLKFIFWILFGFILLINPISTRIYTIITAKQQKLNTTIFYKQIKKESSFRAFAKSSNNAIGLGQLKYSTAKYIYPNIKKWMLYIPQFNLYLSAKYNHYLLKKYDYNYSLSLAAYNWGETNVDKLLKKNKITINANKNYQYLFADNKETSSYIKFILN